MFEDQRRLQLVRRADIEAVLGEKFSLNMHITNEWAYEANVHLVVIRVYSSMPRLENYNEEFIRVCMHDRTNLRMMTWFRVPRDERWQENLRLRIDQILSEADRVRHCECGGLLHIKRGPYGRFEACSRCKHTKKPMTIRVNKW